MSYRENFFADYRTERTLKANGKGYRIRYIYCGDWCKWDLPTARLNRCKLIFLALFASDLGIYLCAGLYPTPANTQPLVAGGGLLALACLVFEAVGLGQFLFTRRKAKARDCRDIHVTMAGSTLLRALFLIVACFGCAWSIRNGSCPASIWPLGGYLLWLARDRLNFSVEFALLLRYSLFISVLSVACTIGALATVTPLASDTSRSLSVSHAPPSVFLYA